MEKTDEKFEGLKQFFKEDAELKQKMMDLTPNSTDIQSEETRILYTDKVEDALLSAKLGLKLAFRKMNIKIDGEIDKFFNKKLQELAKSLSKTNGINDFYRDSITNMDAEFVEEIKDKCAGYTGLDETILKQEIPKAQTINELLHLLHSYIVNNEEILQAMPIIDQRRFNKSNVMQMFSNQEKELPLDYGKKVTLYGEKNSIAKEIFNNYPLEEIVSQWTEIIGLEDRVLIMARDLGHALTINIDLTEDMPLVTYFIPKITNQEMAKQLRGIGKITNNGANGLFVVETKEKICEEVLDFMGKVPTDRDMHIEPIFTADEGFELAKTRKISGIGYIINRAKQIFKNDKIKETGRND